MCVGTKILFCNMHTELFGKFDKSKPTICVAVA